MPRYFFHIADGIREHDADGTVLANRKAAVEEAVRFSGAILHESPELLTSAESFRIEVSDEQGVPLFKIVTRIE